MPPLEDELPPELDEVDDEVELVEEVEVFRQNASL